MSTRASANNWRSREALRCLVIPTMSSVRATIVTSHPPRPIFAAPLGDAVDIIGPLHPGTPVLPQLATDVSQTTSLAATVARSQASGNHKNPAAAQSHSLARPLL